MKSITFLTVLIIILLLFSGCNSDEKPTHNYSVENYTSIITDDNTVKNIISNNIDIKKSIDLCKPIYVYDFDIDNNVIGERLFYPDNTIIFPVLVDGVPVGFLLSLVNEENYGDLRYFEISTEAQHELISGNTIRVALAQWKSDDDNADYCNNYIFVSETGKSSDLFEECRLSSPPQTNYTSVDKLSKLNLSTLEIIKTLNFSNST